MSWAVPGDVASMAQRRLGTRSLRSASRLVLARSTTTPVERDNVLLKGQVSIHSDEHVELSCGEGERTLRS